tara:strand:+ start:3562 stop:6669 length:3108 start_codon:yes stop_codon:yes gene_type:complete
MIKTPLYQKSLQQINDSMYDTSDMNIASPTDVYKAPIEASPEYGFADSFKAGFRQYSPVPAISRLIDNIDFEDDPSYEPLKDDQIPEGYEWRFLNSASANETSMRLKRLDADLKDLEIIENGNLLGVGLGGLVSPLTIAPIGTFKTLSNTSFLKRFVGSAAFTTALYAPEELLIASQNEGRSELAHTLIPLVGAGLIGGSIGGLFGKRISQGMNPANDFAEEGEEGIFRSVGASINPNSPAILKQTLDGEALAETGIKLEKLKWNPVTRLTQSLNVTSRKIASQLVDMGGMIQKKVRGGSATGEAMEQSVETNFRTQYMSLLMDGIRATDEAYLSFRGIVAKQGDIGRSIQMLGQKGADIIKRSKTLSEVGFRERVSKAMRNGDSDKIVDDATPFVNKAAKEYRKVFNTIKKNAEDVKLFELDIQKAIAGLKKQIADGVEGAVEQLAKAESKLIELRQGGVLLNTALGYVPKVARVDKIIANETIFINKVSAWYQKTNGASKAKGDAYAMEMMMDYTKSKPFFNLDEGTSQIDWITQASGTKSRKYEIPDEVIEEFLENDIEVLARHHTKTMGMDIEITRRFGDISMSKVIKQITEEYDELIRKAPTTAEKQTLKQGLSDDLRDVRGLRDRLRGTYGASKDPHNMSSRFVRQMKSFNVLVGMGGAAVSSIPDIIRPVMTEGLKNVYDHGLRHMFKGTKSVFKKMQSREIRQAGIAVDATLGLRANSFADIGDLFGSRFAMERALNQSTGIFFMMNGLNYWNQTIKEFTGNIISLRMTSAIMSNWSTLNKADRRKLLANGIDEFDHAKMKDLIKQHGQKEDGEWLPNTDLWSDDSMVRKFRNALNQSVDRTIITPGAGDRALWTSTEFGSLITQFKGYGQGSMVRLLTSGLQEKDASFWQGAFLLVGLASIVNEAKKVQYGIDKEQTYTELLIDAVDRSGALGWFTDINNSLEKLSDNRLGLRPMMGKKQNYIPFGAKIGSIFGPVASNLSTAGSVATDILTGEADDSTLRSARFITPTGNLPYLDPIWDEIMAAK